MKDPDERVQCNGCREWFWKAECNYFDHGDDGEGGEIKGFECEECTKSNKEMLDRCYKRFLIMCEEYKNNPPQPVKPINFEV